MLIGYFALAAMVVVTVLRRGRIAGLATVRLRHVWLVALALLDQVLIISVLPARHPSVLAAAHVLSYAIAGVFFVLNRRIPGVLLVGAGGLANAVAIAANGGRLPASPAALRASGWQVDTEHFNNSAALAHPHLRLLGDIFATPRWLPGHDVFSIGDVLICCGLVLFLWRTTSPARPAGRTRAAAGRRRRRPPGHRGAAPETPPHPERAVSG